MGVIGDITNAVRDTFQSVGEEIFERAGAAGYVAAAEAIAFSNRNKNAVRLDAARKAALRESFGDLVDDVRIVFGAELVELTIMGRRIGTNPAAQTFGDRIYVQAAYRANDSSQLRLLAHEMVHTRQWQEASRSLWTFGLRYFREYYRAGFSYEDNDMELEADNFARCFMYRVDSSVVAETVWRATWAATWTAMTSFRLADAVYLKMYNASGGAVQIHRVNANGQVTAPVWQSDWSNGWSTFMPFVLNGQPHCLSYKTGNGTVHISRFNAGGQGTTKIWEDTWTTGWSAFAPFVLDGQPHYLAYKSGSGRVTIDRIRADGRGVETLWSDTWSRGWTSFHPFVHNNRPHVLAYKSDGGRVAIDEINANGQGVATRWEGDWSSGWTIFLPLSETGRQLFTFKGQRSITILPRTTVPIAGTGEAHTASIGTPRNGVSTTWCDEWRGSWKLGTAFALNNVHHVLMYGADGGDVATVKVTL